MSITNKNFGDEFGKFSANYQKGRPSYPDEVYSIIDKYIDEKRDLCVDVGCGSGQNTKRISSLFKHVIGIDPSEGQIKNATPGNNIEYRVALGEDIDFTDNSVDSFVSATAFHWISNKDLFYNKAMKMLRPGGSLILFTYDILQISNNEKANVVNNELHDKTLGGCWDPRLKSIDCGYTDINPPFPDVKRCQTKFKTQCSIASLLEHYSSWSGYNNYLKTHSDDPLVNVKSNILNAFQTQDDQSVLVECEYTVYMVMCKKPLH